MVPKQAKPTSTTKKAKRKAQRKKKSKRLSKKQLQYLVSNLRMLDALIRRAFIEKDLECKASSQFSYYKARSELWCSRRSSTKLDLILEHFSHVFVELFQQHGTVSDPFARFLVSWYESLGRLACS